MFDHAKKDIADACGISKERADHIQKLTLPILQKSRCKSQVIEGLASLPGLNEVEKTFAIYMSALQGEKAGDLMGGFMKYMLDQAVESGMAKKLGDGHFGMAIGPDGVLDPDGLPDNIPDKSEKKDETDNLDLFN